MLNVGLMGCGRIAQLKHLDVLAKLPQTRVVALAETDAARRTEAMQRAPQATPYAGYRDLLQQSAAEAVVICLPTTLHAEAAVAAFEAGKHVYLEKPIALSLDEAERVVAAWQRAGTTGMIGFNFRFSPLYREARRQVRAGALGTLVAARSVFSAAARSLPEWKQTRRTGGGVLLDLASHHVDLARFLFDEEIERVQAHLSSVRSEEDTAAVQMTLTSGLPVQSSFSMSAVNDHRFEIYGTEGRLTVDRYGAPDVEVVRPSEEQSRAQRLRRLDPRRVLHTPNYQKPFEDALAAFADAALGDGPAAPDLMDGYRSLAAVAAAEASAQSGETEAPAVPPTPELSSAPHA